LHIQDHGVVIRLTAVAWTADLAAMKLRTALLLAAMLAVALLGILTIGRTLQQPGAIAEMRSAVAELRAAADSCITALDMSQAELLEYNDRLDSLRLRVRGMETLPPRGVPADSYDIYLRLFRLYNDSAKEWEGRVESLQTERELCSALADRHNVAVDSLRRLLMEAQR
jgi:hypothetical protein